MPSCLSASLPLVRASRACSDAPDDASGHARAAGADDTSLAVAELVEAVGTHRLDEELAQLVRRQERLKGRLRGRRRGEHRREGQRERPRDVAARQAGSRLGRSAVVSASSARRLGHRVPWCGSSVQDELIARLRVRDHLFVRPHELGAQRGRRVVGRLRVQRGCAASCAPGLSSERRSRHRDPQRSIAAIRRPGLRCADVQRPGSSAHS